MKVLIIGGRGALGRAIAESLVADGASLRLCGRDARAQAGTAGAETCVLDTAQPATWPAALEGVGLVIDASRFAGRDLALPRAALLAGAHWLDVSAARSWVLGMDGLNDLARERGRVALAGAGFFCGGLDALARAAAAPMVRVNEVQVGVAPGARARYGPATADEWLGAGPEKVRMLLGGEWTEREFFGDARAFEHPRPLGAQRSFNLDCADLELLNGYPLKATSVRVSLSFQGSLRNRVAEWALRGSRGPLALAKLRRLAALGGSPRLAGVTVLVRGLNDKRLPVESRVSLLGETPGLVVETGAARVLARRLIAGEELEPGAGACLGRVTEAEFLESVAGAGLTLHRGDLGGWRASQPV
ncbi:hypothetical protein [Engelhardtia mirabilis]|uniref:Saccharopine dehydrogenase n=1 Tax=Engelhardtia mirabilis TaxID=2528011 RepID=A0A518BLJ6_9BACT|nr:Saccharopine dehydrogenase [Planctomycetes bacterium Pla133]QDV02161.1 Saccharopine dehydrogenase [Planctomycetes bacterium Pla86]